MQMLKNILKYVVLAGLFAIPFIPFIVPTGMFFPFITGKGFTFRIIVEIIFGLYTILALWQPEYRPKLSWITKAVLFFVFVVLLADILSENPYKSIWSNYERMEGFVLIAHLVLYYIVVSSMLNTKTFWNALFNTSILASVFMSIYGLLQAGGALVINQGGDRVDGTFGNATYLAIYLVFHIFICIYLIFQDSKPVWQKWTYASIALLEIVVLGLTATRGAILGLIGGLVLTLIIIAWKERQNKLYKKVSYIALAVIVVFIGLFFSVRNTSYVQTNFILSRFANLSLSEIKTQGRYFVWPMAIKGFQERPMLGWGQESFNYVFNKYYDPRMYGQEQWFDRTHNVFLDWLIAGGILGFLAYFSMYFALLYYIWRRGSALNLAERGVLTGLVSAYLFHNLFVFDNLISYILFFTILGYIHSTNSKSNGTGKFYTKTFSHENVVYFMLPAITVLTIFVIYFVNVPAFSANKTLIKAISPQGGVDNNMKLFKKVYAYDSFGSTEATEQLVDITSQINNADLPSAIKLEFYEFAKQKVEEKIIETPKDARYLVFAGSFFNRFGKYDEAIKYLERAIIESPNKQTIYFELGTSYISKNNMTKAFELFTKAYKLEPNASESQIIYTLGAIYTKNSKALQEMSDKITLDTIVGDNRFLQAYASIGDYQSVINILNARLERDPKNTQHKLSLASVYSTIGQKSKAISLVREVIAENPDFKTQGEEYIKQIEG